MTLRKRLCSLLVLAAVAAWAAFSQTSVVNFDHLRHLTERIEFQGDTVSIVHVYANYPSYAWVDAKESGPEGVACVDDAARAAVVYLRHFELTRDSASRREGISLLRFVMKMETADGLFYNFIREDHTINRDGRTSFASFGWWSSRAVWAMATGYRALRESDPAFAAELRAGIERTLPNVDSLAARAGRYETFKGYRTPAWLLYESGSDATSELLLGLITYYGVTRGQRLREQIRTLAGGLTAMQEGDMTTPPYGLHRSWQTMWHMWGNGQTQALASGGALLRQQEMIASAEREAKGFYSRLLIEGFMKEMDVSDSATRAAYEQIAYAVRPMAVGLLRLYDATANSDYLKMAGLTAGWLFGSNAAERVMYDSATGRCFDGIRDSASINMNSGAESTIEALYTLVELERHPEAMRYAKYRKVSSGKTKRYLYAVYHDGTECELTFAIDLTKGKLLMKQGAESAAFHSRLKRP